MTACMAVWLVGRGRVLTSWSQRKKQRGNVLYPDSACSTPLVTLSGKLFPLYSSQRMRVQLYNLEIMWRSVLQSRIHVAPYPSLIE